MRILKQFTLTLLDGDKSLYVIEPANPLLLNNKVEDLCAVDFFRTMTDLMIRNPAPEYESYVKQFEHVDIDLTYGFDANKLDSETITGLNQAVKDAFSVIINGQEKLSPRFSNGWMTYTGIGTYGDQFLKRAYVAYMGLGANADEEATCPRAFTDDRGNQLNGQYKYILRFENNRMPPVEAFWSVTMYDKDFHLVRNEDNRYAIADYTPGLERNTDGSIDIYIQKHPPMLHRSNWLPAPDGYFNLLLRMYQPKAEVLNGTYEVPGVRRVG